MSYKMFNNFEEYFKYLLEVSKERNDFDSYISKKYKKSDFSMDGYCKVCMEASSFSVTWEYSNGITPNFREHMVCPSCRLNNRQRFLFGFAQEYFLKKENSTIYCYEQVTSFYKKILKEFPQHTIFGSEYLGFDKKGGKEYKGIRHEDAMNLSFDDNSIDLMISQDVLEHVPNYKIAIEETYRVLSDKGVFLFSIPFYLNELSTIQRAKLEDNGDIKYNLEPMYHGNPVDEKGSLVFFDFGQDLFEFFKKAGFKSIEIVSYYNYFYGNIGESDQMCFLARK